MKAMVVKEFRELARDRRTVALLLVIPILLLVVFGYAANFSVDKTRVIVAGKGANEVGQVLAENSEAKEHLEIVRIDSGLTQSQVERVLREGQADAIIMASHGKDRATLASYTHLWVDGSQLFAAQSAQVQWMRVLAANVRTHANEIRSDVEQARTDASQAQENLDEIRTKITELHQILTKVKTNPGVAVQIPELGEIPDLPAFPDLPDTSGLDLDALNQDQVVTVVFNPDLKTSWVMVPGLIGLILTFVGTVVTSIGLVRERETGTLEQLAVMPLRPASIIAGKIAPYFLLSLIDAAIITTVAVWVFKVPFAGAIWRFALLALVFVFVVLGLGVLISVISQNTGQAIQMAIMMVMPQVLLSGLIFPLTSMAAGVRWIGYLLPLTWFNQASNGIMLKDATLSDIALPMGVLIAQAVIIFTLASVRMGQLLRHGGATK